MKFLFIVLLWLIYPLVNAGATSSQNIIVLNESSPFTTKKGLIWRDDSENATIDQVIKRLDEFKPVSELLNSKNENKSGTYWALTTFKNNLAYDYILRFEYFGTEASIYKVEEDGKIIPIKAHSKNKYNEFADIDPHSKLEIDSTSKFTFTHVQKGKQTTIVSKHSNYTVQSENSFPMKYWDHLKFLEWSRFNIYLQGFLLGIFVALSVFSIYYAYINKDLASIIYSLWLLLAIVIVLMIDLWDGNKLSEFFINFNKFSTSEDFFNKYFRTYIPITLSSYIFLIFGVISLNLKINLPTIYKIMIGLLIYMAATEVIIYIMNINNFLSNEDYDSFVYYFLNCPKLLLHTIFIISTIILMGRNFKLAPPLFFAALLHACVYVPYFFYDEVESALPPGLNFLQYLSDEVCSAGQALIMACSIVSRIRYMQDQLNLEANTHREFVENQNKVLEETVTERTKDLNLEMQKSERLMLNILPQSIATRLKAGDEGISDSYQNATILFSDLVGFTKMSSSKTAEELVFLLNDLFKRFDTRATSLGLEKIKTIGDAYMVAGGLPTNDDEHAIRVTKMALGMYEDLEAFNKEHGLELDMRIGINSGPVVAGVIGHSKFSYDLWGNTVNTASRMESTCLPGKVQVSPSTYEQIKGHFDVQENQVIECKGLGQIMTYFVK
jgi:class 3 adenylate cyclase